MAVGRSIESQVFGISDVPAPHRCFSQVEWTSLDKHRALKQLEAYRLGGELRPLGGFASDRLSLAIRQHPCPAWHVRSFRWGRSSTTRCWWPAMSLMLTTELCLLSMPEVRDMVARSCRGPWRLEENHEASLGTLCPRFLCVGSSAFVSRGLPEQSILDPAYRGLATMTSMSV